MKKIFWISKLVWIFRLFLLKIMQQKLMMWQEIIFIWTKVDDLSNKIFVNLYKDWIKTIWLIF